MDPKRNSVCPILGRRLVWAAVAAAAVAAGTAGAVAGTGASGAGREGEAGAAAADKKPITLKQLAEMAQREGLRGRVHGANPRLGTYVFTWSRPGNFFESFNLSLIAATAEVRTQLAALERHQEALVHGRMEQGYGSQPHLVVEALEPGEKWSPGVRAEPPPGPRVDLQKALAGKSDLTALVHAVAEDGGMLVVEWGEEVIPVQAPADPELRQRVSDLFRGDRIRFRFRIAPRPKQPLHLELLARASGGRKPLEVLDAIHALHGRERTVEGRLVLFPKSPVLRRPIYAVEEPGPDGLHRYFTIFNFDDLKDQDRTEARLGGAWSAHPDGVLDARNKYVHTRVRVRVMGKVNNPVQNQANPALAARSEQVQVLAGPDPDKR